MTDNRRMERVVVLLNPKEKIQVQGDASRMRQSVSDYVRSILLHERQTEAEENESFKKSSVPVPPLRAEGQTPRFKALVAKYHQRMGLKAAEAAARKEMTQDDPAA